MIRPVIVKIDLVTVSWVSFRILSDTRYTRIVV